MCGLTIGYSAWVDSATGKASSLQKFCCNDFQIQNEVTPKKLPIKQKWKVIVDLVVVVISSSLWSSLYCWNQT